MIRPSLTTWGTTLALFLAPTDCLFVPPAAVNGSLLKNYDYIVIGGGASGVVLATRLSEDANVTVLLLEEGALDNEGAAVTIPSEIGADLNGAYDWNLETQPQQYLDGQTVKLNQGKVVGGGTVLNGMVWTRGSVGDYDAWDELNTVDGQAGEYGWGWDDLLPYFQKSETFVVDVNDTAREELHIQPDMSVHGTTGPVQVSYPHYFYPQAVNFLDGMEAMGVPILTEPNNGTTDGAFVAPSSMSAHNQSRSDGRVAYLDGVMGRTNLYVATEQMVTRILFDENEVEGSDGNWTASGVEFAHSAQGPKINVSCTREVILAAGAIFSPALLQVSGIGPRDVLESLGVPVKVELPGVGANLQDHGMIHPVYSYTNTSLQTANTFTTNDAAHSQALEAYYTNRTGPLTAPLISTVAFTSLRHLATDWLTLLNTATTTNTTTTAQNTTDATLQRGYAAQRALLLRLLRDPTQAAIELLADSLGTISLAMMRPLSRGTVRARSADLLADGGAPLVDPRYCADALDCEILARGLLFNCALIQTAAMDVLVPEVQGDYFCPGLNSTSSETEQDVLVQMLEVVKEHVVTEFHPSGTTAMLPLDLGGVVDTALRVYGTKGLRIVNAGVMPVVVGAHLQAGVYAVAERAVDIIRSEAASG